jgi:hypothetical protein
MLGTLAAEIVPTFEEHLARLERGINLETWSRMDVEEKAIIIAVRRMSKAVDNLQAEAEIAKSESKDKS